ncbi:MAG TPA: FimV/HubP family polar landmark protein [Rhodanobacteraceae bacterium]|nr:FimV/HubP family polar landmark protein [Rhodanobacteraceae bacterium]
MKFRIAGAVLLALAALPALALQLGEIQVKSALNQPLVAAIPLHPESLAELDGLSVGLASADDFARAGLPLTATDQTLRFNVVTDNNGQKLILVTSSQPVTDPYLDFLLQVNTRQGRQVREFVVLLNPVIAAPAPVVQAAPVASAPSAATAVAQPAELPAPAQFPQPEVKPEPRPEAATQPPAQPPPPQPQRHAAPAPSGNVQSGAQVPVQRGDTLWGIAKQATEGTGVSINQMMLALQVANPEAFFKDNINNLKAGAILRIPTRAAIDQRSVAAATAEVRRQYEAWQAAKPHPATMVEGAAVQAAANAAPTPGRARPESDHLTLAPPGGAAGGASSRPGVAGGTGTETVTDLQQQLQAGRETLISVKQSSSDLETRVRSLEDISAKTGKLLSLKDSTIAQLQRKLAAVQSGTTAGSATAQATGSSAAPAGSATAATKPSTETPWYMRGLTWIIAALVVLVLLLAGFATGRRRASSGEGTHGPLADPDDVSLRAEPADAQPAAAAAAPVADLAEEPEPEHQPKAAAGSTDDPYGLAALRQPKADDAVPATSGAVVKTERATAVAPGMPVAQAPQVQANPGPDSVYSDDPVDTKLDLARAYIDMGDPVGARAMLEEVLEEGTPVQKDEAKRLLVDAAG